MSYSGGQLKCVKIKNNSVDEFRFLLMSDPEVNLDSGCKGEGEVVGKVKK